MRGRPRAGSLELGGQRRPLCEEKAGPGPAGEGTRELRPGDRADEGAGSCLQPPPRRAWAPHFRGGVGLTAAPTLLEIRADICKKRALVGRGLAARPGQYFGTWEQGFMLLCTHELPACKLNILTIYFVTCTCYLNH